MLIGNTITSLPMLLSAHPGTKYGIPFPVLARSSFGIHVRAVLCWPDPYAGPFPVLALSSFGIHMEEV